MDYAFSKDLGVTWINNWGQQIANTGKQQAIVPVSAGITIFGIPKYGYVYRSLREVCSVTNQSCRGILNQEAQTIDGEGRIHVLNRENTTGVERWFVFPDHIPPSKF